MIPTTANDAQLAKYVANIVAAYKSATPDQLARGHAWYPVAHNLAEIIGDGDISVGAGVIAALSQNKRWEENVRLAHDARNGDIHGHVTQALNKVRAILEGTDPMKVLPMDAKTGHFYRNILDPTDPDPVTIDRHAYRVAVASYDVHDNDFGLSNRTRYATLALAYRLAARKLGELPSAVQAVTWLWVRER